MLYLNYNVAFCHLPWAQTSHLHVHPITSVLTLNTYHCQNLPGTSYSAIDTIYQYG